MLTIDTSSSAYRGALRKKSARNRKMSWQEGTADCDTLRLAISAFQHARPRPRSRNPGVFAPLRWLGCAFQVETGAHPQWQRQQPNLAIEGSRSHPSRPRPFRWNFTPTVSSGRVASGFPARHDLPLRRRLPYNPENSPRYARPRRIRSFGARPRNRQKPDTDRHANKNTSN